MRTSIRQIDALPQLDARNACWICASMLSAVAVYVPYLVYLALQFQVWQLFVAAGITSVVGIGAAVAGLLAWRGRLTLGVGVLVGSLLIVIPIGPILIADLGPLLALIAVLLTSAIAMQTLPTRQANRAILVSLLAAALTLAFDQFALVERLALPQLRLFILALAGVLLAIYGFFVTQRLANYSLRARMIAAFIAVSVLSVATMALVGGPIVYVVVGTDTSAAFEMLRRTRLLLALAIACVTTIAAVVVARRLVAPVARLTEAARRVAAGDLSARSGVPYGQGELNQLARAFDEMAEALERREAQLQQAEAKYRTLVEQIPAITYVAAIDGPSSTLYTSPQARALLGFEVDEWMADPGLWHRRLHPDDRERVLAELYRCQASGEPFRSEHRLIARNGRVVWFRDEAVVVRDESGRPLCLQGVLLDITERKRHEREMEAIAAVASALRSATTRAEIMTIVLDQLQSLLNVEGAALALRDEQTGETVIELAHGWPGWTGLRLPPGAGVSGHVIDTGQPYLTGDLPGAARFSRPDLVGKLRAAACVPLIAQQRPIGALWVGRSIPIDAEELRLLLPIAGIVASALHRTALHEQTEQRLQRLAALRTIDVAISSSLDLRVALNVLLDQITTQLGIHAATVLLFHPHTQSLEFAAGRGFRTAALRHTSLRLGDGHAGRAALEQRVVCLPDLRESAGDLARAPLLAGEAFVAYYGIPLTAKGQLKGVLEIFHRAPLAPNPEWMDFLETLAAQAAIAIDNAELFNDLQHSNGELALAYDTTLEGWARALDLRDKETEGHSRRVTEMTVRLARAFGLSEAELVHIRRGALLHDIGKVGIPDAILHKPGKLNDEEWAIMRQHPTYAYELLSPIAYLRPALDIPYCHHEKWDGSGYPRGLAGEQIPLSARIFAVVDVWDALRSDRPYRAAWPAERVCAHIRSLAGSHFDPQVVEIFLREVPGC